MPNNVPEGDSASEAQPPRSYVGGGDLLPLTLIATSSALPPENEVVQNKSFF